MHNRGFTASMLAAAVISTLVGLSPARAAGTTTWMVDPGHSIAEFTALHFMITKVRGSFLVKEASIVTPEGSTMPSAISAVLDATSLDTRNPDRDHDLKGADWFDVTRYPTIEFKSISIVPGQNGAFTVTGDLTIRNVTHPVTLAAQFDGQMVDGHGHRHASYSATTKVDRHNFGLTWAQTMPGGTLIVGNDVNLDISVDSIAP